MNQDQLLSSYDYHLPPELIAQNPVTPRDSSRLLVVDSPPTYHHRIFRDLPQYLQPGDLLVLNNTRVIPARLLGQKSTGAQVEIFLLEPKADHTWLGLVKPGKRLQPGAQILFPPTPLTAEIIAADEATGGRIIKFEHPAEYSFDDLWIQVGKIPFPPYVTASQATPEQYQTVYGNQPGAVAAPTAGLHFTEDLLQTLTAKRIEQVYITLHVGVGTFRPVEVENITTHQMHGEWISISSETVEKIKQTKAAGGRIIAVGTTSVRALEGSMVAIEEAGGWENLQPFTGKTDMFIYPGYQWQLVDGLITNFHLPRSSLLMLVSALIGREYLLELYREAIAQKYRFYSFGDAMVILPQATLHAN